MSNKFMLFIQAFMLLALAFCTALTIDIAVNFSPLLGTFMALVNAFGYYSLYKANETRKALVLLQKRK